MRYLPDDNLSYPILITLDDESKGSGFYLNYREKNIYVVTARHVLYINEKKEEKDSDSFKLKTAKITVVSYDRDIKNLKQNICEIDLNVLSKDNIIMSPDHDVVVIRIGDLIKKPNGHFTSNHFPGYKELQNSGGSLVTITESFFKKFDEVSISNDVIMFGYPVSLGKGIDYEKPLLRKGIVAGKNFKNRTIILDCPVYQGNSGGLVLEIEPPLSPIKKIKAIGLVSSFVPFIEVVKSLHFNYLNQNIENSGYSIITPIDVIEELIEKNSH